MTKTKTQSVEITPDAVETTAYKYDELLFHTEHFWTSLQTDKINQALVKFHKLNLKVEKNGEANINASVKRKYVKLDDIMNIVRPALAELDCYVDQHLAGDSVITRVVHSSGQFIASKLHYQTWEANQVNNLQRLGGGLTYLKRYSICAIMNIVADEDTDGEGNDNVGYKKPSQNVSTQQQDNREWLNLTNKNGSPNAKGNSAIEFIKGGGKLADILKKYRINKTDLATLSKLEQEVSKGGIVDNFREEEVQQIENDYHDMFGDPNDMPY